MKKACGYSGPPKDGVTLDGIEEAAAVLTSISGKFDQVVQSLEARGFNVDADIFRPVRDAALEAAAKLAKRGAH